MALILAIVAVAGVLGGVVLSGMTRRWSAQAPEGADQRHVPVHDVAYLAGGPSRAAISVLDGLFREHVIQVDPRGTVTVGPGSLPPPVGQAEAAAIETLTTYGSMPLKRLWERIRDGRPLAESAARLRRAHLLLPDDYHAARWSQAVLGLATALAVASVAWSVAGGKVAGMVVGAIALVAGAVALRLFGARPRMPVTSAGHTVLVHTFTRYRRGGIPDMAGHATALLGPASIADSVLRDKLTALPDSWTWKPVMLPDDTIPTTGRFGGGMRPRPYTGG
jgi:uncharacterized protein (TIGR04222 family)